MMMHYEKPVILQVENLAEGIYLASGDVADNGGCESQYMNGEWHQQKWYISEPTPVIEAYGCRGCAADDGHKCKLKEQAKWNGGVFKPQWEQDGKDPNEMVTS